MTGTDHWYGITHTCPDCGAKSGGTIPKGHYLGCPQVPARTQADVDRVNAENARARAANGGTR